METLAIGTLTLERLNLWIDLDEQGLSDYPWMQTTEIALSAVEQTHLQFMTARLAGEPAHLLNEATIWARTIYPLLFLGESGPIRARAKVMLAAQYPHFALADIADGALEYTQKYDGEAILKLLKSIVAQALASADPV